MQAACCTKAACILAKLQGKTNTSMYDPSTVVGKLLKDYWGRNGFDCKFIVSDTVSPNRKAWARYEEGSNKATIIISKDYMNNATTLQMANTIIHEAIHAYIFAELVLLDPLSYPLKNNKVVYLSPDLDFASNWDLFCGTNQHEYMAKYSNTMEIGLKEFISRNDLGQTFTDEELRYMSWSGLTGTDAYVKNAKDDPTFSTKVHEVLNKMVVVSKECN